MNNWIQSRDKYASLCSIGEITVTAAKSFSHFFSQVLNMQQVRGFSFKH